MGDMLLIGDEAVTTRADLDGDTIWVSATDAEALTGWHVEERGLCRGDACLLVPDRNALVRHSTDAGTEVELVELARLLDRPILTDAGDRVAAIGTARAERNAALVDRVAPDVPLVDLDGHRRQLSEFSRRRRLLVAFASW